MYLDAILQRNKWKKKKGGEGDDRRHESNTLRKTVRLQILEPSPRTQYTAKKAVTFHIQNQAS